MNLNVYLDQKSGRYLCPFCITYSLELFFHHNIILMSRINREVAECIHCGRRLEYPVKIAITSDIVYNTIKDIIIERFNKFTANLSIK